MAESLPSLRGLLQADPLPMMLVAAQGLPLFRNAALSRLADDASGLDAWLPPNHLSLVNSALQQRRAIEDVHTCCGERHLLWSYIPLVETEQVWVRGRDATQWLQHQEQATVARRLYHLIIENTTDLISRHRPDGRFIDASPASWTLLGVWPEQLRGQLLDSLFHPQEREQLIARFRNALEQDGYLTYTYRIRHRDGHYLWFETASRAIRETYTGEVVEVVSVSRDITERLQSEEQNRRLLRAWRRWASWLQVLPTRSISRWQPYSTMRAPVSAIWRNLRVTHQRRSRLARAWNAFSSTQNTPQR